MITLGCDKLYQRQTAVILSPASGSVRGVRNFSGAPTSVTDDSGFARAGTSALRHGVIG